jgi:hypothetical protein
MIIVIAATKESAEWSYRNECVAIDALRGELLRVCKRAGNGIRSAKQIALPMKPWANTGR